MSLAVPHLPPASAARAGLAPGEDLRRRLAAARDVLVAETPGAYDGWLAAREARGMRERTLLLRRTAALAELVRTMPEPVARVEVDRLLGDVERHLRRSRALLWDSVELELGGSE